MNKNIYEERIILAVDDNLTNLKLLQGVLGADYTVITASNGVYAIGMHQWNKAVAAGVY